LALAPDKSAAVGSSDADASEADHVDENLLQDLLLAFDVDKGHAVQAALHLDGVGLAPSQQGPQRGSSLGSIE
jgi:hypothetical protein